jgi:hypothetical protein
MNPGSLSAIRAGCRCDSRRNQWGRGIDGSRGLQHEVAPGCPLHPPGWVSENVPGILRPSPKGGVAATAPSPPQPSPARAAYYTRIKGPAGTCPDCGRPAQRLSRKYGVCQDHGCAQRARNRMAARQRAANRKNRNLREVEG